MKSAYLALVFGTIALVALCSGGIVPVDDPTSPKPTPSDWFECPGDGAFPNPYNCRKYFVCVSDNAWGMDCPAKLQFNAVKKICESKANANCHETVTTPPKYMNRS